MLKPILIALLSFNVFFSNSSGNLLSELNKKRTEGNTGILEKMIVANGSVTMELDLNRLNGTSFRAKEPKPGVLSFEVDRDSFFTVLVFNNELRGPLPSSMKLIPQSSTTLPAKLNASYQQLVIESISWGGQYDLVVRDEKTGFVFFNIEGQQFDYNSNNRLLNARWEGC